MRLARAIIGIMQRKTNGTPAILELERRQIRYQLREYEHDPRSTVGFGLEGVAKLGATADRVFKTLLADADGRLVVGIVPVSGHLDLKALAAVVGAKKAVMADPGVAEKATGYVVGGISPIGQKRRLPTVLDASAMEQETIMVSGGRRGLDIELAPGDLVAVTDARVAPIAKAS